MGSPAAGGHNFNLLTAMLGCGLRSEVIAAVVKIMADRELSTRIS